MKRRDFLIVSAGLAGALPRVGLSQTSPCPPPQLNVLGGTSVSSTCPAGDAEQDWQSRISGPGVVWFHDFRSDAEVNSFRWTGGFSGGNDPNAVGHATATDVRRITSDGVSGGGCLEMIRRAGSAECASGWWRPFAPLTAPGNGRSTNDPAANGTLSVRPYAPTSGGSEINNFGSPNSSRKGVYGHSSYGGPAQGYDGTEFYLQMRVKMDPNRIAGANADNSVGKLLYLSHTYRSLTAQELVTYSYGDGGNQGTGKNYFRMYGGWQIFYPLDQEANTGRIQPGSDVAQDWFYSGGWDTIMFHLVMGRAGTDETRIEVFAAHPGQTSYTRIWNQTFPFDEFEWDNGLAALLLSTYNNGANMPQQFYHRYDQIIFSKQMIPCPQV
ncbi:MAG: hypothetical protein OEV41_02050 [Gammaproteobacteria bacterium]|nr:hypothetical protein [Gammaproteobacteria bacterium]